MVGIISTATAVDNAHLRIRELVVNAEMMPGAFTTEHELATKFGIAPSDVREAATLLEQEGLVQLVPTGGFIVDPLRLDYIASTARHLSVLEARAAYIAAIKGPTPIGLSALSDAVLTMQDALYRGNSVRWAQAAHHFHRSLVQCSARPRLIAAALALSEPMHRARMISVKLAGPPSDSAEASGRLVDTIRAGAAAEAYDLHLDRWRRSIDAFFHLVRMNGIEQVAAQ